MSYVDGFVLAVPIKNLKAYKKMATEAGKVWKKHGALEYFECVGDDLNPKMPGVKIANFRDMSKLKAGETTVFSFIIYKSRAHRDSVNKKVMKEMEKHKNDPKYKDEKMPFDMKRLAYGGFKAIVEL